MAKDSARVGQDSMGVYSAIASAASAASLKPRPEVRTDLIGDVSGQPTVADRVLRQHDKQHQLPRCTDEEQQIDILDVRGVPVGELPVGESALLQGRPPRTRRS